MSKALTGCISIAFLLTFAILVIRPELESSSYRIVSLPSTSVHEQSTNQNKQSDPLTLEVVDDPSRPELTEESTSTETSVVMDMGSASNPCSTTPKQLVDAGWFVCQHTR